MRIPDAGDISQMLGIVEELPTVLWGATAAESEDVTGREVVGQLRRIGRKGPLLLPGLPRAELWSEIGDYGYGNLIKQLAGGAFSWWSTSVSVSRSRALWEACAAAGIGWRAGPSSVPIVVLAVCRADPVGVKNFIWAYESVREIVDEDRISIVLNRSYPSERREMDDLLESHTGKRSTTAVPDRPSDCRKAIAQGGAVFEVRPASISVPIPGCWLRGWAPE